MNPYPAANALNDTSDKRPTRVHRRHPWIDPSERIVITLGNRAHVVKSVVDPQFGYTCDPLIPNADP
jgi:hypothetical protein